MSNELANFLPSPVLKQNLWGELDQVFLVAHRVTQLCHSTQENSMRCPQLIGVIHHLTAKGRDVAPIMSAL